MKRLSLYKIISVYCLMAITLLSLSSCELIGDIFKAGVWVGVLAVVGIIALILYFIGKK